MRNQTWELAPPEFGQCTVGHKWVYKDKLNADGYVPKLKSRLVGKGIDYFNTFIPMVKL